MASASRSKTSKAKDEYENSLLSQMFKVYRTVLEMMKDRGYNINTQKHFLRDDMSPREFFAEMSRGGEKLNRQMDTTFRKDEDMTGIEQIRVFFADTKIEKGIPKTGTGEIKPILAFLHENDLKHCIIITQVVPTSKAIPDRNEYPDKIIEHFIYSELAYNVTKHFLVPKHRLMSNEEVNILTTGEDMNTKLSKLPVMSFKDPIAKYYGALPGSVFEINRFKVIETSMIDQTVVHRMVAEIPLEIPLAVIASTKKKNK